MTPSLAAHRRNASSRPRETVVLFSVGSVVLAIPAGSLEEIREATGMRNCASRIAKVQHTLDRQVQRYFVVDAAQQFHMPPQNPARLMLLRHAPVAVLVDAIDRMHEIHSIHALPEAFVGEERTWYRGLTLIKGKVVPVVHPELFLTKAEIALLKVSVQDSQRVKARAVTA